MVFTVIVVLIAAFAAGLGFWLGKKQREVVYAPSYKVENGENGAYARFTYADGRVEVRKVRSADFDLFLTHKGRVFEAGEWTPDGHVYREVVNG